METGGVNGRANGRPKGGGRHRESRVARVVDRHSPGFRLEWLVDAGETHKGENLEERGAGVMLVVC